MIHDYTLEILLTVSQLEPEARLCTIDDKIESSWSKTKLSRELNWMSGRFLKKEGHYYSVTETGHNYIKIYFQEIEDRRNIYETRYGALPRNEHARSTGVQDSADKWDISDAIEGHL